MVNKNIIAAVLIVVGLTSLTAAAVKADIPGTNPSTPDDKTFDLESQVSIGAAAVSGEPKIDGPTWSSCVENSRLFNFNIANTPGLSIATADNVRAEWTLQGPIDTARQDTEQLGSIGKVSDAKQSSVKFTNLPPGEYVLHLDVYSDSGSDYSKQTIQVTEGNAVSSCGGGL